MLVRNVSDTARWVAMYRALETERPDAIFRDPFARRLAGDRGAEILEKMPRGKATAWPMVVRTAVFDELILRAIPRRRGHDPKPGRRPGRQALSPGAPADAAVDRCRSAGDPGVQAGDHGQRAPQL